MTVSDLLKSWVFFLCFCFSPGNFTEHNSKKKGPFEIGPCHFRLRVFFSRFWGVSCWVQLNCNYERQAFLQIALLNFITSISGNTDWLNVRILFSWNGVCLEGTARLFLDGFLLTFNYALAKVYKNGRIWIIRMHKIAIFAWLMLSCFVFFRFCIYPLVCCLVL